MVAEGEAKSKSLSWIHMGKPSKTDSSLYFLEGPNELAQLALAPRPLTPLTSSGQTQMIIGDPEVHGSQ